MTTARSIELRDGRDGTLRIHDNGPTRADEMTVLWHHGTPNVGDPPAPLFAASERLGIRWISYDRPGYGGSTAMPGRDLALAASLAVQVADALDVDRFAVMGHSGGASHALATAALLADRVVAAVAIAALAPIDAEGLDWFGGMGDTGTAGLRAALHGRAAKARYEASAGDAAPDFTPADWEALRGPWSWFGPIAAAGLEHGPGGLIDDDLAYVAPWGADPAVIQAPVLLVHGGQDRIAPANHARWLAEHIPGASLSVHPDDSHISVLRHAEPALAWLRGILPGHVTL